MVKQLKSVISQSFIKIGKIPILKGALSLSVGSLIAKALGIAFSLILARVFIPKDYGVVQYSITIGMIISAGTQSFGQHVIARFIGKYKYDITQMSIMFSNACFVLLLIGIITIIIATPVLLILKKFNIGVIVIFLGLTAFYSYWGLSSGLQKSTKINIAYIGSNLVQLLSVAGLIYVLGMKSTLLATIIYGASYFIPLALLFFLSPFELDLTYKHVQQKYVVDIIKFYCPIFISHSCYVLSGSLSIIFLEHYFSNTEVGVFAVAKTIAMVFLFIPSGITTLLMPRAASLSKNESYQTLRKLLIFSGFVNLVILLCLIVFIKWFITSMFGTEYLIGTEIYVIQALGTILFGIHSIITAVLVGTGYPIYETNSRILVVLVSLIAMWLLIPKYGALGAAITTLLGSLAALLSYIMVFKIRKL